MRAALLACAALSLAGCPAPGTGRSTARADADRGRVDRLRDHVDQLARAIGPRHADGEGAGLERAAAYVSAAFADAGLAVTPQPYTLGSGETVKNLAAIQAGADDSLPPLVIGAHYDTVATGTPGADDNASGVAVLLELAAALADAAPRRTIHWVAFTCEEPPFFQTADMGSLRYAEALEADGVRVHAMLALDCVGYFSDAEGSQRYLPGTGPHPTTRGDFVAVVGNTASEDLAERVGATLAAGGDLPAQTQVFPDDVHEAGWSDHWAFWEIGAEAVVISDSGPFRNDHYHTGTDTPDTLDYDRMARLVDGLADVIRRESE